MGKASATLGTGIHEYACRFGFGMAGNLDNYTSLCVVDVVVRADFAQSTVWQERRGGRI
jgi:hypothetical protein